MPIKRYLGNETHEVRFTSGKEIELTEEEIKELCFEEVNSFKELLRPAFISYDSQDTKTRKFIRHIQEGIENKVIGVDDVIDELEYLLDEHIHYLYDIVEDMRWYVEN